MTPPRRRPHRIRPRPRLPGQLRPPEGRQPLWRSRWADTRSDIKAAWIGALAGSLTAALTSGIFTIVTVTQQVDADDRRSTADFLRQEQKTAYADFIAAEKKLQEEELTLVSKIYDGPKDDEVSTRGILEGIDTLIDKQSLIKLAGSPAMVEKGNASLLAHIKHLDEITAPFEPTARNGQPDNGLAQSERPRSVLVSEEIVKATSQDFADQARADLGAEPIPAGDEGE